MMKFFIHYYAIVLIFHIIQAQTEINEDIGYVIASKRIVNGIIDKINNIVKFVQSKVKFENKDELLNKIEKKLMKAAKVLDTRAIKNVQLIMEGIRIKTANITDGGRKSNNGIIQNHFNNQTISLKKLSHKFNTHIKSKLDKLKIRNKQIVADDLKQSVFEFVKNNAIEHISNNNNTKRATELIAKDNSIYKPQQKLDNKYYKKFGNEARSVDFSKTTSNKPKSQTANVDICRNVYTRICSDVKALNSFKCIYDDKSVALEKLCNNNEDCPDRSDEKYCNTHVMKKVEFANRVIADVESSFEYNCFEVNAKKLSLKKHIHILQDVLRAQLNFNAKYQNVHFKTPLEDSSSVNVTDSEMVQRSSNEIALIISSMALALNGALCFHEDEDLETKNDIFERNLDQDMNDVIWPPKSCECKKEFCFNCSYICKRICRDKHSLTRWNCESISNTDSITVDAICDGKLDCFDESDERDCAVGNGNSKFEAQEIFGNTIKMIQSRASKDHTDIKIKLISLSNKITKLQEISTKSEPNQAVIKKLRNKCYSLLSSLFTVILDQSHNIGESERAYNFLLSINKNLVSALKRSHTGNNRIIVDGCFCRHDTCILSYCPKTCVKACSAESNITKYKCQGENASVSINEICDGNRNCPNGYDELECQKDEICRRHHLIVLRHRIQDAGKKLEGTSLEEIIQLWKTKVISTLKIAEKSGRPKPQVIRKIIKDILRDLVLTYGSVESYRRSNTNFALKHFIIIAQQVMSTLKSCGK